MSSTPLSGPSEPADVPEWLAELAERVRDYKGSSWADRLRRRLVPPGATARPASVLMLFGESAAMTAAGVPAGVPAADVLLLQRSSTLRHHSGQVAFPGGAQDPEDSGPIGAALREAEEETGLDPAGVDPLVVMPTLYIPPSGFVVSPVLAYWRQPSPVRAVDQAETARVSRIAISDLVNPANRFQISYGKMFTGPAFTVDGMLVWGFTAGLLAALIAEAGWEQEWDSRDIRELDVSLADLEDTVIEP